MKKTVHILAILVALFVLQSVSTGRACAQLPLLRPTSEIAADKVIDEAMRYLGTPYRWGGKTPKGFDCAGFTRFIYGKFGVELAPSAAPQYRAGTKIKDAEIKRGDLVFYGGRGSSKSIGHVGIVTSVDANGFKFIHSATSTGITISSSNEPYYKKRYVGACRVIDKVVEGLPENSVQLPQNQTVPAYRQNWFLKY